MKSLLLWNEKKMQFTFLQATYIVCCISRGDIGQQSSKFVN